MEGCTTNMFLLATEELILYGTTTFVTTGTLWEIYLIYRQMRVIRNTPKPPVQIEHVISAETFERSRSYDLDRMCFYITSASCSYCITALSLYCKSLLRIWRHAVGAAIKLGYDPNNEYASSIYFQIILNTTARILRLPFDMYKNFVIEERYGFNKQTLSLFFADNIHAYIIEQISASISTVTMVYILKNSGDRLYLWLWLSSLFATASMAVIYPTFILPLSYKFSPLPIGPLRLSIQALTTSVGLPLSQVFVINSSSRSAHDKAFFTGIFGAKRLILSDTLLQRDDGIPRYENDEILAIVCHELGHWKLGHTWSRLAGSQLFLLFQFAAFGFTFHYNPMYNMFGFDPDEKPVIVGLAIATRFVLPPVFAVARFLVDLLQRRREFQADAFVVEMNYGRASKSALCKLHRNNLVFPAEDWLYSVFHNSHPSLIERLRYIDSITR